MDADFSFAENGGMTCSPEYYIGVNLIDHIEKSNRCENSSAGKIT